MQRSTTAHAPRIRAAVGTAVVVLALLGACGTTTRSDDMTHATARERSFDAPSANLPSAAEDGGSADPQDVDNPEDSPATNQDPAA